MATYYVDPINGNDSSAGTSWGTAFKTIANALTKSAGLQYNNLYLAPGTYYEGTLPFNNWGWYAKIIGIGDVLINSSGHDYSVYVGGRGDLYFQSQFFYNIKFTGWHQHCVRAWEQGANFTNCTFYQTGSKFQTTALALYQRTGVYMVKCTLFGINHTAFSGKYYWMMFRRSIEYKCINGTGNCPANNPFDYNASVTPDLRTGLNPIDTAVYPPPFISDSTITPNLKFDTGHINYSRYMTNGPSSSCIGAVGPANIWCSFFDEYGSSNQYITLGNATFTAYGAWQNDAGWFDPAFNPVIISGSANKINFREVSGGAERTATLADGTYATGAAIATQVQTALNSAPSKTATYTVTYWPTQMTLQIKSDGSHLDLMWATGTDTANNAAVKLGFAVSDNTGNTTYTGTTGLYKGPQGSAPSDAALVKYLTAPNVMTLDYELCPNGKHGRLISPVSDMLVETKINQINIGSLTSGTGNISDIQVRANPSVFLYNAAAGTTELDWTAISEDTEWSGTNKYRYWQIRMNLNLE